MIIATDLHFYTQITEKTTSKNHGLDLKNTKTRTFLYQPKVPFPLNYDEKGVQESNISQLPIL